VETGKREKKEVDRMKMLCGMLIAVVMTGVLVAGGWARAEGTNAVVETKAVKHQTICPVMGEPINKKMFVDHEGKRIYVCCGACVKKVKKDPAKYIKEMEDQGITLDTVPAAK
jgi:YHS domain-containing protein